MSFYHQIASIVLSFNIYIVSFISFGQFNPIHFQKYIWQNSSNGKLSTCHLLIGRFYLLFLDNEFRDERFPLVKELNVSKQIENNGSGALYPGVSSFVFLSEHFHLLELFSFLNHWLFSEKKNMLSKRTTKKLSLVYNHW